MAVDLTKLIDLDLLAYFKSKLDLLFATKVDKVDGKGLSSNDYTANEKTKLANIAAGAQVNVLEGIQKNGTTVTITNKIANISVPTKTSDITNDSDFAVDASYVHTDNNYTTSEKSKLGGIAAGAQVNVIESVKVNGTAQTVSSKAVNITVPTKTSQITNDSGFITAADVPEGSAATTTTPKMDGTAAVGTETAFARGDHIHPTDTSRAALASPTFTGTPKAPTATAGTNNTQIATTAFVTTAVSGKANSATTLSGYGITDAYTKTEIDNKLSAAMNYKGTKATVSALPSTGNHTGDVWHVTATNGEYAWNGSAWEELGSTIDLSGYVEDSDLGLATTEEIDALFTA